MPAGPDEPDFDLRTERLGPLPLVNHFCERLGLESLLDEHVPTTDRRCVVSHAKALGVLLRSILLEREPIYRQQETVETFAAAAFGLQPHEVGHVGDDRLGGALDRLFDADRGTLLTQVVVAARRRFGLKFDEIHNDSTTIRFTGQYQEARGRSIRGRRAPWLTYGHSKDHRPDLKQLFWILSTSRDGTVPVQFRCEDGNNNDRPATHRLTWDTLREVVGSADFLYTGDSKLCDTETMDYIDGKRGRFVTVLPRVRLEDREFRQWIQTNEPAWEQVWDRPNPRRKHGPRDRWWVYRAPLPSRESWPVIWIYSALLRLHQDHRRREKLSATIEDLLDLKHKLTRPRCRIRKLSELEEKVEGILKERGTGRYLKVQCLNREEHNFRQLRSGRPGRHTHYRRITKRRLDLGWELNQETLAYDRKSDGMYPLLTNDRSLTSAQVLEAHKRQPRLENRHRQLKSVFLIAPVFLKNEGRIDALFCLYFLAMLIQALIERQVRLAMEQEGIEDLPLYPEERRSRLPTAEQVLRLFSLLERHTLLRGTQVVQVFEARLTELQGEVLRLLGVPRRAYQSQA